MFGQGGADPPPDVPDLNAAERWWLHFRPVALEGNQVCSN